METNRKSTRMALKVYLKVLDEKTDQLFGYLVDITSEGIMLTSEASVETEAVFRFKLEFPAEIEGSKEFSFSAKSMWSEKDSETDFFNSGFKFEAPSEKDEDIIAKIIEKFCFKTE